MMWAITAALIAATITGAAILSTGPAVANACGSNCRSEYNQCRIQTKGSSACESRFTQCMQRCIKK
jgi:hypothetical protein